jgi:hypothetical protein
VPARERELACCWLHIVFARLAGFQVAVAAQVHNSKKRQWRLITDCSGGCGYSPHSLALSVERL